jgi:hypothetical protein
MSTKQLLIAGAALLLLCIGSFAQTSESFDIATFQPPKGWTKEAGHNSLQVATADKADGTYCLVSLFKAIPALASPDENFKASWNTIVKEAVAVNENAQMIPAANKEDWKAVGGYSPFEKDGEKGVAVLVNISGYGKMVNVLILTNTQKYEPAMTAFLESISLKAPVAEPAQPASNAADNASIVGVWGAAASGLRSYDVSSGVSGYVKKQYTFNPNGTYEFLIKTFTYTSPHLLFTKETGTYQLTGNSLTIIPQKSFIQAWTKGTVTESDGRRSVTDNWGTLVSTQNRKLEKVMYKITKHYFSGIQEWQLILSANATNDRDGPFTTNSNFPNSWLYGTQKFPIKPPQ